MQRMDDNRDNSATCDERGAQERRFWLQPLPPRVPSLAMLLAVFIALLCSSMVSGASLVAPLTLPSSDAFSYRCESVSHFPSLDPSTAVATPFPTLRCIHKDVTPPETWNTTQSPVATVALLYDHEFLDGAFPMTGGRAFLESHLHHYLPQLSCAVPHSGPMSTCPQPAPGLFVQLIDCGCSEQRGLANTFAALSIAGTEPLAVLGSACSASTTSAALVAAVYAVPILGHQATTAELGDKSRFPFFTRATYSTVDECNSMLAFCAYHGLQRIALLTSSSSTGVSYAGLAQQRAASAGITIVRSLQVSESPSAAEVKALLEALVESGVRTVLVHVVPIAEPIMVQAKAMGLTGAGWAWLLTGGSVAGYFGKLPPTNVEGVIFEVGHFDRSQPYCKQVYDLDRNKSKEYFGRVSPYTELICDTMWDAGHMWASAAGNMLASYPDGGAVGYSTAVARLSDGPTLLNWIRNISLPSACGDWLQIQPGGQDRLNPTMSLNRMGATPNGKVGTKNLVSLWENGAYRMQIADSDMQWLGGSSTPPNGVYDNNELSSALTLGITILAAVTIGACAMVAGWVVFNHKSPVIRASTSSFNLLILLGLALLCGAAIVCAILPGSGTLSPVTGAVLVDDPVSRKRSLQPPPASPDHVVATSGLVVRRTGGSVEDAICHARIWLLPLGALLLLAPIALKTLRVARIFASSKLAVQTLPTSLLFKGVLGMLAVQLLLCALYSGGVGSDGAPRAQLVLSASESDSASLGRAEWECHSASWFTGTSIAYISALCMLVAVTAWQVRKVPAKFNEAQQLAAICLFLFLYGALLLPLQFLLSAGSGSVLSLAVLRSLGLLLGVWVILVLLFLPKWWAQRALAAGDGAAAGGSVTAHGGGATTISIHTSPQSAYAVSVAPETSVGVNKSNKSGTGDKAAHVTSNPTSGAGRSPKMSAQVRPAAVSPPVVATQASPTLANSTLANSGSGSVDASSGGGARATATGSLDLTWQVTNVSRAEAASPLPNQVDEREE